MVMLPVMQIIQALNILNHASTLSLVASTIYKVMGAKRKAWQLRLEAHDDGKEGRSGIGFKWRWCL